MAAAIASTIAIVDKSGKVVSTSKQLKNVFKEAKLAYQEKKAEIVSDRRAKEDYELQKAIKAMSIAESESRSGSRPRKHRSHSRREDDDSRVRPPTGERHYSGSSVRSGYSSAAPRSPRAHQSPVMTPLSQHSAAYQSPHLEEEEYFSKSRSAPGSPGGGRTSNELVRRRTDMDLAMVHRPHDLARSNSTSAIDMDLAYGEFHPDSIMPVATRDVEKQELGTLVTKCKMLLDEANCAQHSVKAIVAHLQKNPDAMAAVALTLAEISNVAAKMAPGALTALKAGAPAVFALLAAPEFLIAVGVSVGITIVMFGGYKIIKKIKAAKSSEREGSMDEMIEVEELSRIEHWRRGIADVGGNDMDADTASVISSATSVEGEFITPAAARSMGHLPMPKEKKRKEKKHKSSKRAESERSEGSRASSKEGSSLKRGSLRSEDPRGKALVKVKKPSPLRRMFTSRESRDERSSVAS